MSKQVNDAVLKERFAALTAPPSSGQQQQHPNPGRFISGPPVVPSAPGLDPKKAKSQDKKAKSQDYDAHPLSAWSI